MTFQAKGPLSCGEGGPSFELSSLAANNSDLTPPQTGTQVKSCITAEFDAEACERLLEIKRRSLWNIGCECGDQIAYLLGALQYRDDEAAFDHCKKAVANFRAIARLANDLRSTAQGADALRAEAIL